MAGFPEKIDFGVLMQNSFLETLFLGLSSGSESDDIWCEKSCFPTRWISTSKSDLGAGLY